MTELKISGMTCGHCQSAVKTALESVQGVEKADVNLAGGVANVVGDTDPQALVRAVEEEGYQAEVSS